ncbi:tetratricopeptide repeat protein [Leptospira sp. 201903070]|uniref:Tetratricopeptide repeat protein n=1 Tax=Leptospira ainlahdjerensis TaxID=2810033 RepID=A0ABS2U7M5_9LEPT|nr:tetratricopeptide repeat protein [Leptospira ainlahdjerensis]MBM9576366.1 tetratricopeptide repeat protein [Leptospira ainlahdjerensis]
MKTRNTYRLLILIVLTCLSCGKSKERLESLNKDASAAYIRKDLNEALSLYSQILEIEPNSVSTLIMLGKIHYFKKDFDQALEKFNDASKEDRCNATAQYWRSKIESLKIEYRQDAKERLYSVIKDIPSRWEVEYTLGTILESEGKIEDALSLYNQASAESSKLALVYLRLGKIFKKAKRDKMAEQYFNRAKILSEESSESSRLIEIEIGRD